MRDPHAAPMAAAVPREDDSRGRLLRIAVGLYIASFVLTLPSAAAMLLVPAHLAFIRIARPVIAFFNWCANAVLRMDRTLSVASLTDMLDGKIARKNNLITVFGIYSMVTLACNQRRKEIAIRKVNGARLKDIFALFFKKYFKLLMKFFYFYII